MITIMALSFTSVSQSCIEKMSTVMTLLFDEWGGLFWDCAELALSLTFVTHCVTQVMNMYGDLVMDAAPEKVGKTCAHTFTHMSTREFDS